MVSSCCKDKPNLPQYEEAQCCNLYSEVEIMKHITDYISECVIAMGFKEDFILLNTRIGISGLACLVGAFTSIFTKFPEDYTLTKFLVVLFFGLLLSLLLLEVFWAKAAVIAIKDKKGRRIIIDAFLNRNEGHLVLGLRQAGRELTHEFSVGYYFDVKGYLVTDNLYRHLKQLLLDFECGITNDNKELVKISDHQKQK